LEVQLRLFTLPCDARHKIGKHGAVKVVAKLLDLSKRFQEPIRLRIRIVVDVGRIHHASQCVR
jgi:hypothetical protein